MRTIHMNEKQTILETSSAKKINMLMELMKSKIEIPGICTFVTSKELNKHLGELKNLLFEDLAEALQIKEMRMEILKDAEDAAEELVSKARAEIEKVDILQEAENYAKKIVMEANRQAEEILKEAEEVQNQLIVNSHKYSEELLSQVEKDLDEKLNQLSQNRDRIRLSLEEKMARMRELSR